MKDENQKVPNNLVGNGENQASPTLNTPTDTDDGMGGLAGNEPHSEPRPDQYATDAPLNNLPEMREEVAAGAKIEDNLGYHSPAAQGSPAKAPISEEEAKILLADETHKLEQNLNKTDQKSRKVITLVIIVAVIMCIAGVAFALIMGNMNKNEQNDTNNSAQGSTNQGTTDLLQEEQVEELALDDELALELYDNFDVAKNPWDGKWALYFDEDAMQGHPSRYLMMTLAKQRLLIQDMQKACVGNYSFTFNDGTEIQLTTCYAGEDMKREISKLFGEDMVFTEDDVAGNVCGGFQYSAENDEFHELQSGCGGSWPSSIDGKISKIEKKGNDLYIYEKALLSTIDGLYKIDGNDDHLMGEFVGSAAIPDYDFTTGNDDEYRELFHQKIDAYLDSDGDIYKWTFTKNSSGNYVFAGLEKVE